MSIVQLGREIIRLDGSSAREYWMSRPKGRKFKSGDRKGFNSRSGMRAMTDPELAEIERPTVDKAAPLIFKLHIVGKVAKGKQPVDVLTAQGHALYEFLLAAARIQGIQTEEFRVLLTDAKKFLGIKHNARLKALAQQLCETVVEYDFQIDGERWESPHMPLMLVDYVTPVDEGKTYLVFSIHPRVKSVITGSSQWAKIDITAYPKFKCKYTARLYPRLQLYSQYHEVTRKPWIVSPKDLAEIVGFKYSGDFHFGNFEKGCLKPILSDIETEATLLSVECKPIRGKGRGAPVEALSFECAPRDSLKPVGDGKTWKLNSADFETLVSMISDDPSFVPEDMPKPDLILKAAARTRNHPFELIRMWKEDLIKANAYPGMEIQLGLTGGRITDLLVSHGAATAFEEWAQHLDAAPAKPTPVAVTSTVKETVVHAGGYDMYSLRSPNRVEPRPLEWQGADAILASLPTASDEEVIGYCSTRHPAVADSFRSLVARCGMAFEEVEYAFAYAASDRPTSEDRRDFITAVCRYVTSARSDKRDESFLALAKRFRQKHQASVNQSVDAA